MESTIEGKNIYLELVEDSGLYPKTVIEKWGRTDRHWRTDNHIKREQSLRHDMVCILLANLEKIDVLTSIERLLDAPPAKRRRIDEGEYSGGASSSSGSSGTGSTKAEFLAKTSDAVLDEDSGYRYLLIEGMPAEERVVNAIATKFGIPAPSHLFDLFDIVEKQWIEVKVTSRFSVAIERYEEVREPAVNSCLVWVSPQSGEIRIRGRVSRLPGELKATEFILNRAKFIMTKRGMPESDLYEEEDPIEEVFRCRRFNKDRDEWVSTWWEDRNLTPLDAPAEFNPEFVNKPFEYRELAMWIEDTSKRQDEVMKFRPKVLPPVLLSPLLTEEENDEELVTLFMNAIDPMQTTPYGKLVRSIREDWLKTPQKSTFMYKTKKECLNLFPDLAVALGIGRKGTTRNDDHEDLRQEEFHGYPNARYSPWMSELIQVLALDVKPSGLSFEGFLSEQENVSVHPLSKEMQVIRSKFFRAFGSTNIAEYCSTIKNFYSRLGGAYCERTQRGNHARICIFPILSTGVNPDGVTQRRVTGICIRGPHHAKHATDRISFLTIELQSKWCYGARFTPIVKKGHIVESMNEYQLIVRQNAIMKQDPSYLAFIHNATYLSANFLGEIFLHSTTTLREHSCLRSASLFIDGSKTWLMERVVESVLMAILGGSQEEGAFAIIRKLYMAMLAKRRGDTPYSRDWKGLAEALNECLKDSAYALYWGHQTRECLIALSNQ